MTAPAKKGRPRQATACQLCDCNDTKRYPGGRMPRAVTVVCGVRICAGHFQRLIAIAKAAGVELEVAA